MYSDKIRPNRRRTDPKPLSSGRPNRNTVINQDDIYDLVIVLNTTKDVTEFLGRI